MPSIVQLIVWIIIGLLGGSLTGLLVKRERGGFGIARNLGIGLIGAIIGGFLFRLLGLLPSLDKITISLRDVIAAVARTAVSYVLAQREAAAPTAGAGLSHEPTGIISARSDPGQYSPMSPRCRT